MMRKSIQSTLSARSMLSNSRRCQRGFTRQRGFTLVEIVVVTAVLALLAALMFGVMGRGRAAAQQAQCDVRLKALAVALDAHRQETGRFPRALNELRTRKYLKDAEMLRCPADPDLDSAGYANYYVIRAARDDGARPILVCPFHEEHGVQAYKGTYTRQFSTQPAVLTSANGASVKSPGKNWMPAPAGLPLHGGDRIRATTGATIRFADGSECDLQPGGDLSVLQCFVEGQGQAPLHTLLRQHLGAISYRVHHGSKFDVTTPTATAGALGTKFVIEVQNLGNRPSPGGSAVDDPATNGTVVSDDNVIYGGTVTCTEGKVYLTYLGTTINEIPLNTAMELNPQKSSQSTLPPDGSDGDDDNNGNGNDDDHDDDD